MLKTIIPAAVISVMAATASWAAVPAAPAQAVTQMETNLVEVQQQKRKARRQIRRQRIQNRRYRAGYRYRSAPAGWRRYDARPYDWQTRGCVIVGPIWFCP